VRFAPRERSYGFEDATGEVKLKIAGDNDKQVEPNTVTVMLSRRFPRKRWESTCSMPSRGAELASPLTVMSLFRCEIDNA